MDSTDALFVPRWNKYCVHQPFAKQAAFLVLEQTGCEEALYGGAVGGGKSDTLLTAAAQYVDVQGYAALLMRRTFADLMKPDCLIPRSLEWWGGSDARWNSSTHSWTFPSGAKIAFGYCDTDMDVYQYQSSAFQFIGFDELTQFSQRQYTYLFSRLRRPTAGPVSQVPLRMRAGSNPGGVGHEWVKQRFVDPGLPGAVFIPAGLADNAHLDGAEYVKKLAHLDPVTRAQLLRGDWSVRNPGSIFRREWFGVPQPSIAQAGVLIRVRFWDLAASVSDTAKYTAGVRMAVTNEGKTWIEHVVRGRWTAGARDDVIAQTAAADPPGTLVRIEQEPGSGGLAQIDTLKRRLYGYSVSEDKVSGDKGTRAGPFASHAEAGHILMTRGQWNGPYLDELEAFQVPVKPDHIVDQVDASSGAYNFIAAWLEAQHIQFVPERAAGWETVAAEDDPYEKKDPLAGWRPRSPF